MDAHLAACTEYMYRNGVKTGCHLHDNQDFESRKFTDVYFLLNGKFDGSPFQNTFKRTPRNLGSYNTIQCLPFSSLHNVF